MTSEERLKAAGWHVNGAKCVTSRAWTKDRIDFYTESEALVVVLTAERDAAIARAERAEAERDSLRYQIDAKPCGLALRSEWLCETAEVLGVLSPERVFDVPATVRALIARAEAAEALAASRMSVAPERVYEFMRAFDDAECEAAISEHALPRTLNSCAWVIADLRAHAAKVSR